MYWVRVFCRPPRPASTLSCPPEQLHHKPLTFVEHTAQTAEHTAQTAGVCSSQDLASSALDFDLFQHVVQETMDVNFLCALVFRVAPGLVETYMAREVLDGPNSSAILVQHPLGRVAKVQEDSKLVAWLDTDAPVAMTASVIYNGASYLQ